MKTILHLDDNQSLLTAYKNFLSKDFRIISESCSTKLGILINSIHFDGIILDIHMPYIDGPEAIKIIRESKNNKDASIFMLSMDNKSETRIDYIKDGVTDFLSKDMEKEEILVRIQKGLEKEKDPNRVHLGNLILDKFYFSVSVNDLVLNLTLIEYKLLNYLLNDPFEIKSREEITDYTWNGAHVDKNVLNTHLCNLKSKLKDWDHEIQSVRFKGMKVKKKEDKNLIMTLHL